MTFAIVPAAGHSRRMGMPKLTLLLHGRPVIEHVIRALREGGVPRVLVVVGPHVSELAPLAQAAGADVLMLDAPTADMRATVEVGLAWIEEQLRPAPETRWLLAPADHPVLSAKVVRQVLASKGAIVVPVHAGRRGHPTGFRWHHIPDIRALEPGVGINVFLHQHADETEEVAVTDPGVLTDLDTPADYTRLCEGTRLS